MVLALATPGIQTSQSEASHRFLTQKELDPDAIAFNSQNSRYHFPARVYLPSRGVFGQVDLLIKGPTPIMRSFYTYVDQMPTYFVDPWGLQEAPGNQPNDTQSGLLVAAVPTVGQLILIGVIGYAAYQLIKGLIELPPPRFRRPETARDNPPRGGKPPGKPDTKPKPPIPDPMPGEKKPKPGKPDPKPRKDKKDTCEITCCCFYAYKGDPIAYPDFIRYAAEKPAYKGKCEGFPFVLVCDFFVEVGGFRYENIDLTKAPCPFKGEVPGGIWERVPKEGN